MADFYFDIDQSGVATITWDCPDKFMNLMSWEGFNELDTFMNQAINDPKVKGIVLASGKDTFTGGMDLKVLGSMKQNSSTDLDVFNGVMTIHRILRNIELAGGDPKTGKAGKPVAIALNGTSVGIGYEIAISTHRIICADNPKASIGLPEILVGIFPGGGGTTRLARRLGILAAAPFILKGKTPKPKDALDAGLVDEVVPPEQLISRAKEWVLNATPDDIIKPWDKKGFKVPGGSPYDRQGFLSFAGASALIAGETQCLYPAAQAAISTIYEGMMLPFDQAIRNEAKWFAKVLVNPSSSAMINTLFVNKKLLEKGHRRPKDTPKLNLLSLGVIGAGMMGSGIAQVAAQSGLSVFLVDKDETALEKGKGKIQSILEKDVARGRMSTEKAQSTIEQINFSTDLSALRECKFVIEAVFEDPDIKADIFRQVSNIVSDDCLIASNTSTLPISDLSKSVSKPERFVGIHFFSPVQRMALVEIIKSRQTNDQSVSQAFDLVRKLRKTPIIVNDSRFFYANRCIIPYINEGVSMVGEGYHPALIENAAKQIGMPLGPLQLIDETSLELAVHIATASREALGDDYMENDADRVVFKLAGIGRLGRKSNAGFYEYDSKGKRLGLWEGICNLFPPSSEQPSVSTVKDRLLVIQVVEAIKTLQEDILVDVREGDVGAIFGWGFAPWSGGPFSWVDTQGIDQTITLCSSLKNQFGKRFEPPTLLQEMKLDKRTFY
ncbi:MAG: 3-hydroxyacyl-CoA dehydrogenase NAD-binding domain-containing protein [Paracoccaceae bacterium]|nr:3-hydroxyacyl-CoA dehydrogenase NAD-binding domain-containing protein [Paracoccaceae bacterium]MDE2917822.1 3-hydroxyacyl-CoA dehydrogenase NAD-binding domain-containing protein [Paracoccaceae bacterium]